MEEVITPALIVKDPDDDDFCTFESLIEGIEAAARQSSTTIENAGEV